MKATILQANFAKTINYISRIVSNRTTLPVLNNVLINAGDGKISMSATDLEVAITSKMAGKVDHDGKITIPARLLSDFVLNNRDNSIEIELKGLTLHLKSEHFEANIKGIDADEFPSIPSSENKTFCKIKLTDFSEALHQVNFAAANDDTRPVLAGVLVKFEGKELRMVATDSYRLAEKRIMLEKEFENKEVIVPARTMNEVMRIISQSEMDGEIEIILDENQIFFGIEGVQVVSRLIEGSFPPYAQIIPAASKIVVKTNLAEILSALKMSSLFAKDIANNIKMEIADKKLILKSAAGESGDTTSSVAAETKGGKLEIAFNARYLMDVMNVLSGKEVEFKFNDDSAPGIITCEQDKDYLYLAMPLKTDS